MATRTASKKLTISDVYHNMYPWSNLNQFFDLVKGTISYKSPDNSLIALCKPYGVGIYTKLDNNRGKQNQDKLLSKVPGQPHYCMQDILKPLSDELNSPIPYQILKGIDRYMSGLILLSNKPEIHHPMFVKSLITSRSNKLPPFGLRAIASGYPTIQSKKIYERVGLEMIEVDDLGNYKEPIIVNNPSRKFTIGQTPDKDSFQVEMSIKKINREYSTSLIELYVSKLKYDFARCYISSKTSFILGDVRFSKRIREILGKPIQVSAFKSSHRYDDSYEPLNSKVRDRLGVYKNASIPLMLDLHAIRLKGFDRTQKSRDLFIQSPYMPIHFALTAERLNLLDDDEAE